MNGNIQNKDLKRTLRYRITKNKLMLYFGINYQYEYIGNIKKYRSVLYITY